MGIEETQDLASKANTAEVPFGVTGGSCKESSETTSWIAKTCLRFQVKIFRRMWLPGCRQMAFGCCDEALQRLPACQTAVHLTWNIPEW